MSMTNAEIEQAAKFLLELAAEKENTYSPDARRLRSISTELSKIMGIASLSRPCLAEQPNLMPGDQSIPQTANAVKQNDKLSGGGEKKGT